MNRRLHKPIFFILIVRPPQEDCEIYPPEENSDFTGDESNPENASGENFSETQISQEETPQPAEVKEENSPADEKPCPSDLSYYKARYYHPTLGRFLQRDPLGYVDGYNLYSYVNNNPLNWIDPLGLEKLKQEAEAIQQLVQGFYQSAGVASLGDMADLLLSALPMEKAAGLLAKIPGVRAAGRYLAESFDQVAGKVSSFFRESFSTGRRILVNEIGVINPKRSLPEKLYHYGFSENVESVSKNGLRAGQSGKIFTTTSGNLTPLQTQIDLALEPNRGLRSTLYEIDTRILRQHGIEIPKVQSVGRSSNMPGGGTEIIFDIPVIPKEALRRLW